MKFRVSFEIDTDFNKEIPNTDHLSYFLEDLLKTSTLPALEARLVPLTLNVTKKRGN